MPFKSKKQREYLAINKPAVAEEFAEKTPDAELPERVSKRAKGIAKGLGKKK